MTLDFQFLDLVVSRSSVPSETVAHAPSTQMATLARRMCETDGHRLHPRIQSIDKTPSTVSPSGDASRWSATDCCWMLRWLVWTALIDTCTPSAETSVPRSAKTSSRWQWSSVGMFGGFVRLEIEHIIEI